MTGSRDDITRTSLSGPLMAAALLLCLALAWAIYDEGFGQRPWKGYQEQFRVLYTAHLRNLRPTAASAEQALYDSPELRDMERQLDEAERTAAPRLQQIRLALGGTRARLETITGPLQDARARIATLVYGLDHAADTVARLAIQQRIDRVRQGPFLVDAERYTLDGLEARFNALRAEEAQLAGEETAIGRTAAELRRRRNEYLSDLAGGVTTQRIDSLLRKMETFPIAIRQIHVAESELVDRCESCHLGIRDPLAWAVGDTSGPRVFARHSSPELLTLHDPERFGCSPCHNGNGSATSSVEKAHGLNRGWPWALFDAKHQEAGCLQCHRQQRILDYASVLTRGRDLYQTKGCAACHRYEGFDREVDALTATREEIRRVEREAARDRLEVPLELTRGDSAPSNDEARQHYARATSLRLAIGNLAARLAELRDQAAFLAQDRKAVGPSLKDVRLKLRKSWIPVWLNDPQGFRPGTNMPHFRLADEERRAVAAFVWQAGVDTPGVPPQPRGDPARGRESFETRGCLGCHSIGEGQARVGDSFAPNLSRLGEKADYNYVARWIHDPRERTTLMAMPGFRLSWAESRDIASYLTSLKRADASYPSDVSYMDDPRLAESGRGLVNRYGCANCHEIRGFENVPRVGTELTREGSKPIEQLDFGLLAGPARREGWYSPTGFLERKLTEPAIYDRGREKAPGDRLRMPDIALTAADVQALATLLIGSVDMPIQGAFRTVPAAFRYEPTGAAKDLQEGWWIVKKYNCMGCHAIQAAQASSLSALPRYQDPDWKEKLPPALHQEGARVNPWWLARFLANPSLNETDPDRNGVRSYLQIRMPTFNFSPNEIRALVRFFEAQAGQADPYVAPRLEPLDARERDAARALFSSRVSVCVKCHVVGDPRHDRAATAPDLLLVAGRLKPDWTARWMVEPQELSPGTAMPAKLFRRVDGRWMFAGRTPGAVQGYTKDHAQLLVRYMFQLTADEQRRLLRSLPASPSARPTGGRRP